MILYINSLLFGAAGAWLMMRYGAVFGFSDEPVTRSSHHKSTPKGAGIGVIAAFVIAAFMHSIPLIFWMPAFMISLVSFWGGDRHRIAPGKRLIFQFLCSCCVLFFIFCYRMPGWPACSWGSLFIFLPASVFIVGTSNFYNFMDGIDGIAGITAVVAFSLLAWNEGLSTSDNGFQALCLVIVFSSLGFLIFNFPKAKVFMGDVGSVFLGFLFSCFVILLSDSIRDFFILSGFLSTFYYDELITMWLRFRDGEDLMVPHRKHIYQMLVNEFSYAHWKIALLYGGVQLLIGMAVIRIGQLGLVSLLLFYLLMGGLFLGAALFLRKKAREKWGLPGGAE